MKPDYLYDPHAMKAAEDIVAQLTLCRQLLPLRG